MKHVLCVVLQNTKHLKLSIGSTLAAGITHWVARLNLEVITCEYFRTLKSFMRNISAAGNAHCVFYLSMVLIVNWHIE